MLFYLYYSVLTFSECAFSVSAWSFEARMHMENPKHFHFPNTVLLVTFNFFGLKTAGVVIELTVNLMCKEVFFFF